MAKIHVSAVRFCVSAQESALRWATSNSLLALPR